MGGNDAGKRPRRNPSTANPAQSQTPQSMADRPQTTEASQATGSEAIFWDWELPISERRDRFDHAGPLDIPHVDVSKGSSSQAELNVPRGTPLPDADITQLSPTRSLKRKSLIETMHRNHPKRASVSTTEPGDRPGRLSPTSVRPDNRSRPPAEEQLHSVSDEVPDAAGRMDLDAPSYRASISTPSLSPRKVFAIQVGHKMFRLSGSSISSDGELPPRYTQPFFRLTAASTVIFHSILWRTASADRWSREQQNPVHRP